MPLFNGRPKCQLLGFVVATVGWVLRTTSMALAEWRVWYINSTSLLSSCLACVGVWRACIFHQGNSLDRAIGCQGYSYFDSYVPLDIPVAQILLPLTTVLFSKPAIIFALKNMYLSKVQKTCDASAVAGMLSIAAGAWILAAVVWNHLSVKDMPPSFPPSFNVPCKPDSQEVGEAALVACLGSFALLVGGLVVLFYKYPLESRVHPAPSDTENSSLHWLSKPHITRVHSKCYIRMLRHLVLKTLVHHKCSLGQIMAVTLCGCIRFSRCLVE